MGCVERGGGEKRRSESETGEVWAESASMTRRAGGKEMQGEAICDLCPLLVGRRRQGEEWRIGMRQERRFCFCLCLSLCLCPFHDLYCDPCCLCCLPLPLSGALPLLLPLRKSGSGGLKSRRSREDKAPEECPGAGGRRGVVPGAPTGSTPGEGFQGGGRSPASSVVRSESCSRRGVLLRGVGPGVVIGKSGTTNAEAEPAGKGGGTGAAGENGSGGGGEGQ